jgi:hypothetical protein
MRSDAKTSAARRTPADEHRQRLEPPTTSPPPSIRPSGSTGRRSSAFVRDLVRCHQRIGCGWTSCSSARYPAIASRTIPAATIEMPGTNVHHERPRKLNSVWTRPRRYLIPIVRRNISTMPQIMRTIPAREMSADMPIWSTRRAPGTDIANADYLSSQLVHFITLGTELDRARGSAMIRLRDKPGATNNDTRTLAPAYWLGSSLCACAPSVPGGRRRPASHEHQWAGRGILVHTLHY